MIVKVTATLRISSSAISAQEMTAALGIEPSYSSEKGDLVSRRSPKPAYRKESRWSKESGLEPEQPLEEHIFACISIVRSAHDSFTKLENCQADIFCGIFSDNGQMPFDIDTSVIRALAPYEIDLIFDPYTQATPDS